MSTKMKELFKTDLDPNSSKWWSTDKIDKINLNFKQFSDGGQVGPRGFQGAYGVVGYAGNQGPQGPQGIRGFQGVQGISGERIWNYLEDTVHRELYVFPKAISTTHAVSMRIGEKDGVSPYGELLPESVKGPALTIDNRDSEFSQLTISCNESDVKKRADFKYTYVGGTSVIRIGNLVNSEAFILDFKSNSTVSILDAIQYSPGKISFDKNSIFNIGRNILSKSTTRYTKDAGINKVLVSTDSLGSTRWVSRSSVFGNFPIGSIISIQHAEFFNDSNFYLDEIASNTGEVLSFRWGKGKPGTPYEGWYLCNGETWDYLSLISYIVPNLNSFNYAIDSNGDAQDAANGGDNSIVVVGGWNSRSTSTDLVGSYTSSLSEDDTSDVLVVFDNVGSTCEIKRNIQIIYLEDTRLLWENNNSIIVPTTLYDITLTQANTTSTNACSSTINTQFKITNSNLTWSDFLETGSGYELYNASGNSSATPGWYQREGVSRYWNGTGFTQKVTCDIQRSFAHGENVLLFNGPAIPFEFYSAVTTTYNTFYINAVSFTDATIIKQSTGENCVPGWYREVAGFGFANGSVGGTRRYWNGNSFIGLSIDQDYVRAADNGSFGLYYGTSTTGVCDSGVLQKTYYSSDISTFAPSGVVVNSTPLVHVGYSQGTTGHFPLSKVNTQNGFGVYSPYSRAKSVSAPIEYGIIDATSGIISSGQFTCPVPEPINTCKGYTLTNGFNQATAYVKYIKCGESTYTQLGVPRESERQVCTDGDAPIYVSGSTITITPNSNFCPIP